MKIFTMIVILLLIPLASEACFYFKYSTHTEYICITESELLDMSTHKQTNFATAYTLTRYLKGSLINDKRTRKIQNKIEILLEFPIITFKIP